ncbi:MAG: hypothetical protein AB8G99_08010 [Planctomycetaceae bacterium]
MDSLITQITSETDVSEDSAREIVELVTGHVRSRLPGSMHSVFDCIVAGSGPGKAAGAAGGVAAGFAKGVIGGFLRAS